MKFSVKKILRLFSEILIFILAVGLSSCDHLMDDLDAAAVLVRENEVLRINHYYQNIDDDDYTFAHTTYIFSVEAGTSTTDFVTPFTKNKTGFTALPFEEKTIQNFENFEEYKSIFENLNIIKKGLKILRDKSDIFKFEQKINKGKLIRLNCGHNGSLIEADNQNLMDILKEVKFIY